MTPSLGPLDFLARIAFYAVAVATLCGALVAVSARNLFRAALGLAAALFGVAVLYLFLQAEFLALTQLLIYVGAILTLIIFGVMLTARIADPSVPRWNRQAKWAALLTISFFLWLGHLLWHANWGAIAKSPAVISRVISPAAELAEIGRSLVSNYLLPFELLSLLLVGALVGAIVIARKTP